MNTGRIEIKAKIVEVLNKADSKLPFTISQFNRANETVSNFYYKTKICRIELKILSL